MQPRDRQKPARNRHARRDQPSAEPVEQRFRRYVVSPGLDQPSMKGDEVGYAEEIWHALEKWRVGPHGAMPFRFVSWHEDESLQVRQNDGFPFGQGEHMTFDQEVMSFPPHFIQSPANPPYELRSISIVRTERSPFLQLQPDCLAARRIAVAVKLQGLHVVFGAHATGNRQALGGFGIDEHHLIGDRRSVSYGARKGPEDEHERPSLCLSLCED